jgi:hypothetical protein
MGAELQGQCNGSNGGWELTNTMWVALLLSALGMAVFFISRGRGAFILWTSDANRLTHPQGTSILIN